MNIGSKLIGEQKSITMKNATLANIGLMLLLSAISALLLLNNLWPHWTLSVAALAYFCALCFYVMRVFPAAFVLMMLFLIMRFTTMLSGIAIESGGNMHEILTIGEATGASIRLAAVYTIGVLWAAIALDFGIRKLPNLNQKTLISTPAFKTIWMGGVFACVTLCCLMAVWIGWQNGFPLLTGEDRIAYWRNVDSRFLYFFLGNRFIFALFLGLIVSMTTNWRQKTAIAIMIVVFGISFLFAEKFTSIITMIVAFITPVFLRNQNYLETLAKRLIPLGILAVCLTLPVILMVYGVFEDPQRAIQKLQARTTSQSQIWYITDRDQSQYLSFDTPKIIHNIKAMGAFDGFKIANTPPFLGVKDIMANMMEEGRYRHYVKNGITLTMGTEGYLLQLFGRIGMILPYLLALSIYAAYLLYLYYAIRIEDPIRTLLIAKIMVWSNFALNQGYFWFLFGVKSIVLIAIIILYELVIRTLSPNKRRGNAR